MMPGILDPANYVVRVCQSHAGLSVPVQNPESRTLAGSRAAPPCFPPCVPEPKRKYWVWGLGFGGLCHCYKIGSQNLDELSFRALVEFAAGCRGSGRDCTADVILPDWQSASAGSCRVLSDNMTLESFLNPQGLGA